MKRCGKCKEVKGREGFNKCRSRKDGLQHWCKACDKAHYNTNRDRVAERRAVFRSANREKVSASRKAYYEANREKVSASRKAYYEANRETVSAARKAYRKANREKVSARNKAYREANRDKVTAAFNAWYEANKKHKVASDVAYQRNRHRTDHDYRLRCNLRTRLRMAIRNNAKTGSAVSDLGCSIAELWLHLESQFQPGMTRENYGKLWHVDHNYPLAAADLTDRVQFLAACNWRNLQPMLGPENLRKKDVVTPEAQRLFDELVREFSQKGVA
jgi:hypothetical protein